MSQPIHEDVPKAEQVAELLKALGHPLRIRIVSLLAETEMHVNALAERLGAPQAIISQQLRILRMAMLVDVSRAHGHATYRLAEPQLENMLACMALCHSRARPAAQARATASLEQSV